MNYVLDSSALIAFFRDEDGADEVENLLRDAGITKLVHSVNLCELYYDLLSDHNEQVAEHAIETVLSLDVVAREDMDSEFWRRVGRHKATLHRVSLADCFCLSLAQRERATVLTSDGEFRKVARRGLCPVKFMR